MTAILVHAQGHYAALAQDTPTSMQALMAQHGIACPRRTNRFTQLSLFGAQRCADPLAPLPPETSIYLASAYGNAADTAMLMQQLVRDELAPEPVPFINVSSNMAGYYIANRYGLCGRNLVISRRHGAWEAALELACLDLTLGNTPLALVGAVDECVWPLADHRRRLGAAPDAALWENSAWLVLGRGAAPTAVPGYRRYATRAELLAQTPTAGAQWVRGAGLDDALVRELAAHWGAPPAESAPAGTSPTASAVALAQALESPRAARVHHLSGNDADGYLAFCFARAPRHEKTSK